MALGAEVTWLDATAQAALVKAGEVRPIELVETAIARIERLNPALNAVIDTFYELARAAAAGDIGDGPFAGVPFLLKDLVAEQAGTARGEGSAFLAGHYTSDRDSELVVRLKRAGLIVLGKTNTPEFGLVPTTEPSLTGPTRNPWDRARTPGDSSGGSAAAVAAGMVAMAHANDGGGSIRVPASCCGLVGLKPTRGRNPLAPHYGDAASGLVVEHAVTRSVRDAAALLDATAGPAPGDPYWAPPPAGRFRDEVDRDPGQLRIAPSTVPPTGQPAHPDCVAAARGAAELCAALGHEVEEAAPAIDGELAQRRFGEIWAGFLGWAIADWQRRTGRTPVEADFEPATWRLYQAALRQTGADYLIALQDLQRLSREIAGWFADYDLMLTPTMAEPPVPLGHFAYRPETARRYVERIFQYCGFTMLANLTGQPAISVPLHWSDAGLPIGVQFMARFGDEASLIQIAAQLEMARPWADRRPPEA